jgi:hypothetical protein
LLAPRGAETVDCCPYNVWQFTPAAVSNPNYLIHRSLQRGEPRPQPLDLLVAGAGGGIPCQRYDEFVFNVVQI